MERDSGGRIMGVTPRWERSRARRSTVVLELLAAMSLAAFGLATGSPAGAASSEPWTACTSGLNVTGSPVPTYPMGSNLYAVSAQSATDTWAVGDLHPPKGPTLPLVEHWNGSAWSQETIDLPAIDNGSATSANLQSVVTFSPTDAWAGGFMQLAGGPYVPLLFHWNGSGWAARQFPIGASAISVIALTGTGGSDLWVGEESGGISSYVAHFDGTAWSVQNAPFTLLSLVSFAPDTVEEGGFVPVFVNGDETSLHGEIGAYQNGRWSLTEDTDTAEITDISGTGPDDIWAVELPSATSGQEYELQHYTEAGWTNIAPALGGGVVTATGVDTAEAVLSTPYENQGISYATQVSDPDGPTVTSLSMTPITWDPSWGYYTYVRAISATPRGAIFAVGTIQYTGSTVQRGIIYRDCAT
jgi:hypothetical protein